MSEVDLPDDLVAWIGDAAGGRVVGATRQPGGARKEAWFVDVAFLYDGFTFNAISWLEGLGFCGLGEAQDWLDGGRRIALGGELPVNPHGGQLSEGRTHGFGFIYEAIAQLRHDAGERQVVGAATAVVTSGGGTPSGVLLLQRDGS